MRRAVIAERILNLVTDRERAASIAGDLAESAETRGGWWFWRSVAVTAGRLGVVPMAVFAACIGAQFAVMAPMASIMNAMSAARHGRSLSPAGPILAFSAALLASLALYLAFRAGLRDRATRLAGALAIVAFTGAVLQQTRWMALAGLMVILAMLLAAVIARPWRRAASGVLAAFLVSALAFFAVVMANNSGNGVLIRFPVNFMLVVGVQWLAWKRVSSHDAVVLS